MRGPSNFDPDMVASHQRSEEQSRVLKNREKVARVLMHEAEYPLTGQHDHKRALEIADAVLAALRT